jgi:uncharacterized protein YyaL (SSP411 family)
MKKFFIVIMSFILTSSIVLAQESISSGGSVKWYSWNEGYKKAKQENKIVIVDVYTDWCGWCKVMDKKTYTDATVISKIQKKFITIKVNPEKDQNLSYDGKVYSGQELINLLTNNGIEGYPTTIFFFPKSKKMFMEVGYLSVERFNPILDKYAAMK